MPTYITLAEMAKREKAGSAIAEQLNRISPLMSMLPFEVVPGGIKEYGVREALPNIAFRGANETLTASVSVINPYAESCAIAESNPWIDRAVVTGNPAEALALEMLAHVEKIKQLWTDSFFYGDREVTPKGLDGVNTRVLGTGSQFVSGGGNGSDTMSCWIFSFGPNRVQGIVPDNQDYLDAQMLPGLVKHETLKVMGYQGHVYFRAGIAVCDPRAIAQYGNLEYTTSNMFSLDGFEEALSLVSQPSAVFMPRKCWLRFQSQARSAVSALMRNELGQWFADYGGLPIFIEEALTITETVKATS